MEIKSFTPDLKAIEKRKGIKPFGTKNQSKKESFILHVDKPARFVRCDIEEIEEDFEEKPSTVYKYRPASISRNATSMVRQEGIYYPPSMLCEKTTIKITNLPLYIDKIELDLLIIKKTGIHPLSTYVVLDKETRASRGYAFVEISSADKAKETIKKIDGFAVDGFLLGAELAPPR